MSTYVQAMTLVYFAFKHDNFKPFGDGNTQIALNSDSKCSMFWSYSKVLNSHKCSHNKVNKLLYGTIYRVLDLAPTCLEPLHRFLSIPLRYSVAITDKRIVLLNRKIPLNGYKICSIYWTMQELFLSKHDRITKINLKNVVIVKLAGRTWTRLACERGR